ncbi:MAG: hypothetical protein R3268_04505 [Acidiferrobacterales bacterium]|nr:hypothetical protein [Acidiferrobacterales bacterium]
MFEGFRPKAVLFGILADIGTTFIAMMVVTTFLGTQVGDGTLSQEELMQRIERALQEPPYLLLGGLLGLLATVLGGYVAARTAEVAPLLNAACVGVFDVVLGIFFIGRSPLWFSIVGLLLTLPAAIAGGVLFRRTGNGPPR